MKTGIIFDMDGTLWDSAENVAISWDAVVREKGNGIRRVTTEDIQNVMGHTMTEIAEMMFPMLDKAEGMALMEQCCLDENAYLREHGGVLYPKLEKTLQILSEEYPLYIVSNCQQGYIEAFLEYYHFEKYFQDRECFGNTNQGKAYNIRQVVERNQLEQAVYVGDIQGDYNASMEAGVGFVHAAYGFGTIEQEVPVIHEFAELPSVVRTIFGKS